MSFANAISPRSEFRGWGRVEGGGGGGDGEGTGRRVSFESGDGRKQQMVQLKTKACGTRGHQE